MPFSGRTARLAFQALGVGAGDRPERDSVPEAQFSRVRRLPTACRHAYAERAETRGWSQFASPAKGSPTYGYSNVPSQRGVIE